eukprot:12428060-Karenia_brevis.AAC.1
MSQQISAEAAYASTRSASIYTQSSQLAGRGGSDNMWLQCPIRRREQSLTLDVMSFNAAISACMRGG